MRFGLHALLLGNASASGQARVGVPIHNHIALYLLGVASEGYQQNACFEVSPKVVPLSSRFGLRDCLILLLQTNNRLRLGDS